MFSMKRWAFQIILIESVLSFTACSAHQKRATPPYFSAETAVLDDIHSGDLIFLDLDCGDICDAIEDATKEQFQVSGPRLSHVGVLEVIESESGREMYVYEAWPGGGVVRTPLIEVLKRVKAGENQENGFYIGRFKDEFRELAFSSLPKIQLLLKAAYDDVFLMDNGRYYCSELVYAGFPSSDHESPVFRLHPMMFGSPGSKTRKTWEAYYSKLNQKIPDGELGLSPLSIYLEGREIFFK